MGLSQKWFRVVRKKFIRSSGSDIVLPRTSYSTNNSHRSEEAIVRNETATFQDIDLSIPTFSAKIFNKEDLAAIRIQAYFRGHLARRAYRALKSLVKVQALVRGVRVRRQSRIALQCMHALVRLQVTVRSRQLLGRSNDNDNRYILT